jgi:hypothetical protein
MSYEFSTKKYTYIRHGPIYNDKNKKYKSV